MVLWWVLGLVAAIGLGVLFGRWAFVPPQVEQGASAPATVTVTEMTVGTTMPLAVSATWERVPFGVGAARGTLTSIYVADGELVQAGQPLYTVDSRPVVAAVGRMPAFRDLQQGDVGTDVQQLQELLRATGHFTGLIDGVFGASTHAAVLAWQRDLGISDIVAHAPSATEVSRAEAAIRNAELNLIMAQRAFGYFLHEHHPDRGAVQECSKATNLPYGPWLADPVNDCIGLELSYRNAVDELRFAQADRTSLVAPTAAGVVQASDIVFTETLPARVLVADGMTVGRRVIEGDVVLLVLRGEPEFVASISFGVNVDFSLPIEVDFDGATIPAVVAGTRNDMGGNTILTLTRSDGTSICADRCDLVPLNQQEAVYPARQVLVPTVTGPGVPAAAVWFTADGQPYVVTADGQSVNVQIVGQGQGRVVLGGIAAGSVVVLPHGLDAIAGG